MNLIDQILEQSKVLKKRIVLPETDDPRTLSAIKRITDEGIADIVLIERSDVQISYEIRNRCQIFDPQSSPDMERFVEYLVERRQHKGMTESKARKVFENPLYVAAAMVAFDVADGCVAGAVNTTADVLRAGIQIVGVKKGSALVSSTFLMSLPDGRNFTFGDCAVNPYPDEKQLASIAIDSAETHHKLTGEEAKVAMLSFSTKGSAQHDRVTLVREALEIARTARPDLSIDGELQLDAAILEAIGKKKAPGSAVAGHANVLIFPNLDAGNIGYKLTERLAGASATGPIIQGIAKPFNDLSRGCSADDIVNTVAVCSLLAQ